MPSSHLRGIGSNTAVHAGCHSLQLELEAGLEIEGILCQYICSALCFAPVFTALSIPLRIYKCDDSCCMALQHSSAAAEHARADTFQVLETAALLQSTQHDHYPQR